MPASAGKTRVLLRLPGEGRGRGLMILPPRPGRHPLTARRGLLFASPAPARWPAFASDARAPPRGETQMRPTCIGCTLLAGLLLGAAALSGPAPAESGEKKKPPEVPPRQGKSETIKLFNGKDLEGW